MTGGNEHPAEGASLTLTLPGGHELSVDVTLEDGEWEVRGTLPAAAKDQVEGKLPEGWKVSTPRQQCYIKYVSASDDLQTVVAEARAALAELAELPPTGYWFQAKGDLISIDHWPGSDGEPTRLSFARIEPQVLTPYEAGVANNPTTAFISAIFADGMAAEVEFVNGEVLVTLTPETADDTMGAMSKLVALYAGNE